MHTYDIYPSPIGNIYVVVSENGLCRIELFEENWIIYTQNNLELKQDKQLCKEFIKQIDEYFTGNRKVFDFNLDLRGTEFQRRVWDALRAIPYGKTKSYKEIAAMIGSPKAVRAVGGANRANELPLVIPCHRVIGANGKLVGFAGDKVWAKAWLLKHEGWQE